MGGTALYAVSVVNASLTSFRIAVEVLQVVVEVDRAGAEVSSEERGVRGEDGGNIYPALFAEGESNAGEPFVELANDGPFFLVIHILREWSAM